MKINKITFGSTLAFVLGAALTALPASATTISFTTTATPASAGPAGGASFTYVDAAVGSFDPTSGVFFNAASGTISSTFGGFTYNPASTGSSVIDIKLAPTVNGGAAANLDFKGVVSSAVIGGVTAYSINFGTTVGGLSGTGSLAGYTELVSNGITYAVQTTQQLNVGKQSWLSGYVQGIPGTSVPEPATLASSGLALALIGFAMRRKAKANS